MDDVRPGKYRHYKGNIYEVICLARHSETEEEYVVYKALYGTHDYWIRPRAMFSERVIIAGRQVRRFVLMDD
jgi:hypothetical protein